MKRAKIKIPAWTTTQRGKEHVQTAQSTPHGGIIPRLSTPLSSCPAAQPTATGARQQERLRDACTTTTGQRGQRRVVHSRRGSGGAPVKSSSAVRRAAPVPTARREVGEPQCQQHALSGSSRRARHRRRLAAAAANVAGLEMVGRGRLSGHVHGQTSVRL